MHHRKCALSIAATACVLLGACGTQPAASTTVTVTASTTATVSAAATAAAPVTVTVTEAAAPSTSAVISSTTGSAAGVAVTPIGKPADYVPFPGNTSKFGTVSIDSYEWATEDPAPEPVRQYPQNSHFLVLDVTVTCTKGKVDVEDYGWRASTADGTVFEKAISSDFKPKLPGFEALSAGDSATGKVVLDVEAGPVRVTWKPSFASDVVAGWDVPGPS